MWWPQTHPIVNSTCPSLGLYEGKKKCVHMLSHRVLPRVSPPDTLGGEPTGPKSEHQSGAGIAEVSAFGFPGYSGNHLTQGLPIMQKCGCPGYAPLSHSLWRGVLAGKAALGLQGHCSGRTAFCLPSLFPLRLFSLNHRCYFLGILSYT